MAENILAEIKNAACGSNIKLNLNSINSRYFKVNVYNSWCKNHVGIHIIAAVLISADILLYVASNLSGRNAKRIGKNWSMSFMCIVYICIKFLGQALKVPSIQIVVAWHSLVI